MKGVAKIGVVAGVMVLCLTACGESRVSVSAHRPFYRGAADPQPAGIAGLPQPVRHPRRLPH